MGEYNVELQDGIVVGGGGSDSVWLPNVSEEGEISWSKSASTTPPETRNIKGDDGAPGQDGEDGLGIKSVDLNGSNHLIVTYDDDTTHDAGEIEGGGGSSTPSPSYKGKTVVHMGDSWVELYNIAELAAQKVGYTVINVGMQATAIASVYNWSPSSSSGPTTPRSFGRR